MEDLASFFKIWRSLLAVLGIIINLKAMKSFMKKFNIQDYIMSLLFTDSILTVCGLLVFLSLCWFDNHPAVCLLLPNILILPYYGGQFIHAEIAAVRLITLHMGRRNQPVNKFFIKMLTRSLLLIYIISLLVHALAKSLTTDAPISSSMTCPIYVRQLSPDVFIAFKILVFMGATITALICGLKINQLIITAIGTGSLVQANNLSLKDAMRIPTRATVFSVLSGIPILIMSYVVFGIDADIVTTEYLTTTLSLMIAIFRTPCSILIVHSNKRRQDIEVRHRNEVEARRRKEIEWAWKTRVGRVAGNANNQQDPETAKVFTIS